MAAALGASTASDEQWLAIWIAAAVAVPVGVRAMRSKARRYELALWSAAGRRFAQGFVPAIAAGAVLTFALASSEPIDLVPAAWLLLYGAGVLAGSSASVPVLAWLGALFMVLGIGSLFTPPAWRDLWLAAGFGVLQIAFGVYHSEESWRVNVRQRRGRTRPRSARTVRTHAAPATRAANLDRLVHDRTRLAIVTALSVNPSLSFTELRA